MVCHCFEQWSAEHSHTRRTGSGGPRSTDVRRDRRIVRVAVAASRQEIRTHVSPRTTGNSLLAARLRLRVPLTMLPLTPRHRQARLLWCRERVDWRVEWHSVVFNDDNWFCLYANDEHIRVRRRSGERHLPECIRPRHAGLPQASWWGGHQRQLVVRFGVFCWVK